MTLVDKLLALQATLQDRRTMLVGADRQEWIKTLDEAIEALEVANINADDDDFADDDDDDDDDELPEGTTYLSSKVRWQVAHALRQPEWQVEEEPEDAVLALCEKVLRK